MRRLLILPVAAFGIVAGLSVAPAYAGIGPCVSLDEACWDHQCDPNQTIDEKIWWQDTGPIIHICA